jgi:hypothetical protein
MFVLAAIFAVLVIIGILFLLRGTGSITRSPSGRVRRAHNEPRPEEHTTSGLN